MTVRLDRDAILEAFHGYGRPRPDWKIGAEFERHLLRADGSPLPYFGTHGVRALLLALEPFGWKPHFEGEHPIALSRGAAMVTLEPGAQFELSGTAVDALEPVYDEALRFAEEVAQATEGQQVHQVALGFTPYARIEDIEWVPKGRYGFMRTYLGRTGPLAHHMMKGTCAVQASFDYSDEQDAAAKVQLAMGLGPLTTAMFANSPLAEGRPSGFMSWRGHIWTQTDPRRTGFPEAADRFGFEAWVDYLLQVPMMFRKDAAGRWIDGNGTFADWLADSGTPPTWADWDLHMTSVFPEVRVKRTIEVRGADCVALPLAMSFVALFKGLFYCDLALEQATELAGRLRSHGSQADRFAIACRDGLHGVVGGRTLGAWGVELLELADAALDRCAPEDKPWLQPLIHQVALGESPARTLLRRWRRDPSVAGLLMAADLRGFQPGRLVTG